MRHAFGGDLTGWVFTSDTDHIPVLAGGVTVTAWNAQIGGTQITDLATDVGGVGAITQVTTLTIDPYGSIPQFWGPDEVWSLWLQAGAGPRLLAVATDTGDQLGLLQAAVALLQTGAVTLDDVQTITGAKTLGPLADTAAPRLVVMAETTGQTGNLLECFSGTDTGLGGVARLTTRLNNKGELRVSPAAAASVAVQVQAVTGQTGHLLEQLDASAVVLSWMGADGAWRAPNLGHTMVLSVAGNVAVSAGKHRLYNDTGVTLTIRAVRATLGTAPTGAAVIVDVNKNGTTIFTTQSHRPTVAISGNTSGKVTNMDVTTLADGDYLTVDIDQIGSSVAGADLTVQILTF